MSVGDTAQGARLPDVRIAEPYVVPGNVISHGPSLSARRSLVVAAVIVCALTGLAAWYFTRSSPGPVQPGPVISQASVRQWCDDLRSGKTNDMYQQLSSSYQRSTTLGSFESRLLGSGTTATCTSTTAKANQATISLRQADGEVRTVDLDVQDEKGQWQIAAMKVSPQSRRHGARRAAGRAGTSGR
jgi:hypothetical protein